MNCRVTRKSDPREPQTSPSSLFDAFFLIFKVDDYFAMSKGKRLDVKTKLEVLNFLSKLGVTQDEATLALLIARQTLSKIWMQREVIKQVALESKRDGVKMIFRLTRVQILTNMVHQ